MQLIGIYEPQRAAGIALHAQSGHFAAIPIRCTGMDMKRQSTGQSFLVGLILSAALSSAAGAQQAAAGGPAPGAGDAGKSSSAYRESNSAYNRLIGSADPKAITGQDSYKSRRAAVPATIADIRPGSALRDSHRVAIGTVESLDDQGAIVNTGAMKIRVPVNAFGKDEQGLVLGITAARFSELVAKANAAH